MRTLNPYLIFNGNCEDAFAFYKSVFGGEFIALQRFNEIPTEENGQCEPLPENWKSKIAHICLQMSSSIVLLGGDTNPNYGNVDFGQNLHLSVQAESKANADKLYNQLAEDGTITMPITDMFWGDYFGMVTDKFGIRWMISYRTE